MKRIFVLETSLEDARRSLAALRSHGLTEDQLHVIAGERWKEQVLPAQESTLEEQTDVNNAQARGSMVGAVTGAAVGLGLAFTPGVNFAAASALLIGSGAGGGIGLAVGTIVGASERHPLVTEFSRKLEDGQLLVAADVPHAELDEVIAALEAQGGRERIYSRSLFGTETMTSAA